MDNSVPQMKVMIAGIGGASLGTEILKCLLMAGHYHVYGCDISSTAYGLYDKGFLNTYHIDRNDYVSEVIAACHDSGSQWLIPGGEQPSALLAKSSKDLIDAGIHLVSNNPEFVTQFSDKKIAFDVLSQHNIPIPRTFMVTRPSDILKVGLPCIVKPATGSGGSASVFFAQSVDEAMIYVEYIQRNGSIALVQEYINHEDGEYTIGVLSLPDGQIVKSIAMRRTLDSKLSRIYQGRGGVISSGYSQGYIDEFPALCQQAENIAKKIGNKGPMNIQGRVRDGVLLPFEINPRFSASTYLRALSGFNEVDIFLTYLATGKTNPSEPIKPGWYLRSFTELYVADGDLR